VGHGVPGVGRWGLGWEQSAGHVNSVSDLDSTGRRHHGHTATAVANIGPLGVLSGQVRCGHRSTLSRRSMSVSN